MLNVNIKREKEFTRYAYGKDQMVKTIKLQVSYTSYAFLNKSHHLCTTKPFEGYMYLKGI